jgi:transposase, IS5 family
MKKSQQRSAQIDLFAPSTQTISLPIDQDHPMVRLKTVLDWEALLEIAERYREMKITTNAGAKPHLRANVGAVVVRAMKSCDLRTAADLVENYLPARYLCDLHESRWTPDFRTLFDFEVMLGDAGLSEINTVVLRMAQQHGFLDVRGLCSDTTAQEARIPYPNEVGLMDSFTRSVKKGFHRLGKFAKGAVRKVDRVIEQIKTKVRHHRLFAKTKQERLDTARTLARLSKKLLCELGSTVDRAAQECPTAWNGELKKAFNRLYGLRETMSKLLPQIEFWIRTGFVASDKIVSLFIPECRAIVRGKVAKPVEFGLKWGINQIRGGYISLFDPAPKKHDTQYVVEAVIHHQEIFGCSPKEFGFDRIGWADHLIESVAKEGVSRIGIAPKGSADWLVSDSCRKRIQSERAQVEGKIGTIKHYGFNKPNARSVSGMRRAAHRAELRFNMTRILKDMALLAESRRVVTA